MSEKTPVNYVKLEIRISELQTECPTVAPWEVDVLRAIYGGDVQTVGVKQIDRAPPEARDEFARLANRYGPKNAETPIVAAVYGNFGPGVKALQDAIDRAYAPVEAKEVPTSVIDDNILAAAAATSAPVLTDEQIAALAAPSGAVQAVVNGASGADSDVAEDPFQSSDGPGEGESNPGESVDSLLA